MKQPSIRAEVRKFIADKIAHKEVIAVDWLTHEIVNSRADIEGEDAPFYRVCAYKHVRDEVKACVDKYDAKTPVSDSQLVLDGFEHLQVAYTVERKGITQLVPIDMLTDAELTKRAIEFEDMAKGCRKHALEIRGYVKAREEQRAA